MIIRGVTVGPLEENCWLVIDETAGEAVLVDPGDEPALILDAVHRTGVTLAAIWLTHGHFDHIGGIAGVRRAHPTVPIYLHPLDLPMYQMGELSAGRWGIPFETPPAPDMLLEAGQQMQCGTLRFEVHHVPGHAPGHVMFVGEGVTLSGDLLFKGSIGRTDLPLCDPTAMEQSLARAAQLPPATKVYPGHGSTTTIAHELETNPFLNRTARVVGA